MKVYWINGVSISNLSITWNKKILYIVYLDAWITIVVLLLLSNNGDPYVGFMIDMRIISEYRFSLLVSVYMFATTAFHAISLLFVLHIGYVNQMTCSYKHLTIRNL